MIYITWMTFESVTFQICLVYARIPAVPQLWNLNTYKV